MFMQIDGFLISTLVDLNVYDLKNERFFDEEFSTPYNNIITK